MKFTTKAIHMGEEPNFKEGGSGDVCVPIHMSSTFAREELEKPTGGYEYSRTGNPTRHALENKLAAIENARYGLAFGSGMAAETTLSLSLLKKGDNVIAFDDLYGGTKRLFNRTLSGFGLDFSYIDARSTEIVEGAIKNNTRMIWLESPTNPLLRLCDIREISKIARDHDIITVVDNTFASPFFQNPLDLGADIVVQSSTKYIGGHSDVIGGAVMLSNEDLYRKIKFNQNALGGVPSPFDCFLVLRGIKTLAIRMERHGSNAQKIAEYLESSPKVNGVNFPWLKSHPQHELATRQMSGPGGMLSFELKGDLTKVKTFLGKLRLFSLAESLGGVESLVEHPALMTHASVPVEDRLKVGITDSLIRLSVGIEDLDDLIGDLDHAFSFV
jgi:cystathionine gamma-lyase